MKKKKPNGYGKLSFVSRLTHLCRGRER